MLLVVDATKGMQAQTMECVVIGEAVMAKGASVIVVLNKVIHGRRTCRCFLASNLYLLYTVQSHLTTVLGMPWYWLTLSLLPATFSAPFPSNDVDA